MKHPLRYFILVIALMTLGALAWLSATESGLRWLLARITPVIPGELSVQEIHGRLIGPVNITGLKFRNDAVDLSIAQATLEWAPTTLLWGTFHVTRLYAREVDVSLHPRTGDGGGSGMALAITLAAARVDGLAVRRGNDSSPFVLTRLDIQGRLSRHGAGVSHLHLERPGLAVTADGELTASAEKRFDGHIRWSVQLAGHPLFSGSGDIKGDAAHTVINQTLDAPVSIQLAANFYELDKKLRWTAHVNIRDTALDRVRADWPALQLRGELRAGGSLTSFRAQADLDLAHNGKAAGSVTLRSHLTAIDTLPQGVANVSWRNLVWPVAEKPLRSARGDLHIDGTLKNYAVQTTAVLNYGNLAGVDLRAEGRGTMREFQLTALRLDTLEGRIDGRAQVAWTPKLAWNARLNGKNLNPAQNWRDWPGRIGFQAEARGERKRLEGKVSINDGLLRGRPFNLQGAVAYDGTAMQLRQLELRAPRTRLDAHGTWGPSALELTWTLNLDDLPWLMPQLSGSIASRGKIQGTRQKPEIAATFDASRLLSGTNHVDTLRAEIKVGAKDSRAKLTVDGIAIPGIALDRALFTVDGELAQHRLRAEISASNGRLEIDGAGAYADGAWNGVLTQALLKLARHGDWRSEQAAKVQLRAGNMQMDTWCWQHQQDRICMGGGWQRAKSGDTNLRGQLVMDVRDLAPLAILVPRLEKPRGTITADLRLNGTAAQPRLSGHASLAQAAFRIPELGLDVHDVDVRLQPAGERELTVDGRATSGGTLHVKGRVSFGASNAWVARIDINGDNVLVSNTSELQLRATPDLVLRAQSNDVRLDGQIDIPRAQIHLQKGNGATKVSSDVVYVGPAQRTQQTPRHRITTRVRIILGNDVWVDGFNFRGRIGGNLLVEEQPQTPDRAQGELHVVVGEYTVYRKTLQIERGRLIFSGGPLADPWFDIRATRRIEEREVVVGVRAQGSLKDPKLTLFSEPTMSDTDVLAYMLLDHPIEQASSSEGKMLYNASNAIGLAGGELLAKRIGSSFGIEDVRVEQKKEHEASLVLGKYLSPRLYVGYGIGLFESENELRLRYQLSRHWQVQTETGTQSGVDLLYKIER